MGIIMWLRGRGAAQSTLLSTLTELPAILSFSVSSPLMNQHQRMLTTPLIFLT